jgi:lipoprotein-releasing system ATP-binding protein
MKHKSILSAKNLRKKFYEPAEVQILTDVNLEVNRGESVAIMGRSGEGKSTLLQVLGTLETPCGGILEIDGQAITRLNKSRIRNCKLGFVFQSFHLLEDYSAIDNVLMPAKIARKDTSLRSDAYRRACMLMDRVGLNHRLHFNTKLLSGGEKQRVALARALCNDPDLILADEPSGNLDKETSKHIHALLMELTVSQGKTLIVVTHDPDLADLCSHRYRLQGGALIK